MGILESIGLQTAKDCCFYPVGQDSAVLVGIKCKKGKPITVPERIKKYTIRGIDDPFCPGRIGDAFSALDEKDKLAVKKKLADYQMLSQVELSLLPATVEYIGQYYQSYSTDSLTVPSHIHYIRNLYLNCLHKLILPSSLRYLGKLRGHCLVHLDYSGPASTTGPQLRLSDYLGYEAEEIPQISDEAFMECPKLRTLILGDHIEKIGKSAMPPIAPGDNPLIIRAYTLHIPRQLQTVASDEFHAASVSKLIYPDDLSESLRCRQLPLCRISHLIIHDSGQLKRYTQLLAQGEDPVEFPDKCLYHLIRRAERITLSQTPRIIFDGMFAGCEKLQQLNIGVENNSSNPSYLTIAEGVEEVGSDAFNGCHLLVPKPFPRTLRRIGDRAFFGCNNRLNLPEGLSHIGSKAFANSPFLRTFNLPSTLTYLAPDAFENCPKLQLTPAIIEQLARFPEAQAAIQSTWEQKVLAFINAGDQLLFKKDVTMTNKQAAYEQYRKALELDPFRISTIYRLERLLLTEQVPHGITAMELANLQSFLKEQNSLDVLQYFEGTLDMLDSECIILSDPEDIITQRLVYGLNCDQGAAAYLLKFLLDAVEKHPKISESARYHISSITGQILCSPTRNKDQQSEKQFLHQKKRNEVLLGAGHYVAEKYSIISKLTSENLMTHFQKAMALPSELGFYDAEFWLELAKTFNPKVQIPHEFTKIQECLRASEEARKWRAEMQAIVFPPEPVLPTPSCSYRDEEEERRLNDLVSDYWAEQAAKQAAAEIEDLWAELDSSGFWDDTSWQ